MYCTGTFYNVETDPAQSGPARPSSAQTSSVRPIPQCGLVQSGPAQFGQAQPSPVHPSPVRPRQPSSAYRPAQSGPKNHYFFLSVPCTKNDSLPGCDLSIKLLFAKICKNMYNHGVINHKYQKTNLKCIASNTVHCTVRHSPDMRNFKFAIN